MIRRRLADLLLSIVLWLVPDARFFPIDADDEPLTGEQWAALLILHAEAVHDCAHTGQARAELGIVGPRGRPAEGAGSTPGNHTP